MKIIPAIDLINGQCVRLYQGKFEQTTQVAPDPLVQLQTFIQDGAERIHIVDLDGARSGQAAQFDLICQLIQSSSVPIQVGGGIRQLTTIENYVEAGVQGVILGTGALEDRQFTEEALKRFGDHVIIGIDAINGKVATKGWKEVSLIDYIEFAQEMETLGAKTIIYTDISKDGTLTGPNIDELKQLQQAVNCKIIASGGVTTKTDLIALEYIGIQEAIVGKAIYQGTLSLKEVSL
ncbi:phosphoribosylformimino-5-aminoimidazole carboxamide ribotide isomerase [Pullulanibacillus pueri]|uniref:1-(5-phosphoribosyl)-5-[(5-phosphoribosylamino)methylideneamino] imidazole-4-carboxamide isomerase n=1 Tax=Pullulanibacillus pueri TaxID=1437324 RepID=A0A8J3EL32_9BACL|nr:1-(5-phosphoribosyl)-5-[(5-phosphoribosylamino)methylideneamino]imidazole-4-carboxamide isomerase [Pullulanibacillus pueri]MBM7681073.1 phosphoribosylformimino-5-aminoimidazole carboxamide ribotide isomerase [Pullulanibacillus pueri]GGH76941.1 1-(5-phosphoribosyl)-5-[(5-phosphoribosylamino) methylideneamino] imidazole-4-carboxamide isomerase [Pullulanibacillus pueri]